MENQIEGSQTKIPTRRRSGREIEEWIERYRQSGQSARAFALAHGLRVDTLRGWLYRRGRRMKSPSTTMIPVKVTDSREAAAAVTLRLPTGIEVEFRGPVAVSTLKELIKSGSRRC
jgi:hypothetical protein